MFHYKCDDQGGPQPPKPWEDPTKPSKEEDKDKDKAQKQPKKGG